MMKPGRKPTEAAYQVADTFRQRVKSLASKEGLLLFEFSAMCGFNGIVWLYSKSNPSAQTLMIIAETFHVTTDWLLGLKDE